MGTHNTDRMWKPEAWSACKGGVRRPKAPVRFPVTAVCPRSNGAGVFAHLCVEAGVLADVADVDRKPRGSHQLSNAVVDQPV